MKYILRTKSRVLSSLPFSHHISTTVTESKIAPHSIIQGHGTYHTGSRIPEPNPYTYTLAFTNRCASSHLHLLLLLRLLRKERKCYQAFEEICDGEVQSVERKTTDAECESLSLVSR